MAYEDPARAKKRTRAELRKLLQEQCKGKPCAIVADGGFPPCVVCVHEGKINAKKY